jgi:hypothetical protein
MKRLLLALALAGCKREDWSTVVEGEPGGLLAVSGTAADDVWAVGAQEQGSAVALHWDGQDWTREETGAPGDLWWVSALPGGSVYAAGEGATVLRRADGAWERMDTPGAGHQTVFGLWAGGEDDVWAVGGFAGRSGFVWRWDGEAWSDLPLPLDIPRRGDGELPPLLKVWGDGEGVVYVVGGAGTLLRSVDGGELEVLPTGTDATLFTVHGRDDRVVAVGVDGASGVVLERDESGTFADVTPEGAPPLQGVCLGDGHDGVATGFDGRVLVRGRKGWQDDESALPLGVESLHAAWIDPDGGEWLVGGNVVSGALDEGILQYRGKAEVDPIALPDDPPPSDPICPADAVDPAPRGSIARRWNEQILNAIRRDTPRPGVHARNLFHVSVAIWDAWAAYDPVADGYLVTEKHAADDVEAARAEAISYAAWTVLHHRYAGAVNGEISEACFDAFLEELGYDPADTDATGDTPRAVGNRIGQAVVAAFADDGANEQADYADTTGWESVNPPLVVDEPGVELVDVDLWAQLNLAEAVTQNGIVQDSGIQGYIGPHWGSVTPFAGVAADPGEAPVFAHPDRNDWVMEVIRKTAWLDPEDDATIDISPASFGNNPLGSNDGSGYEVNPATGEPYAPQIVLRSDFSRVLAEFWADGPKSETPPGHWNTLANAVADAPETDRRLFGEGEALDPLAWDVHVYLALNGALHDAAIAAWGLKREHLGARPIAWIRYQAMLGQSSDPGGPSYHPDGLPLEDGLVEVVTEASSAPGERHAHLRHFVGEIAIWTWRGEPGDRAGDVGGHAWVRGVEWIPYQRRNFVTPAFPGYISGHSTFSRSGAEVLAGLTGSPYFPGGLGEFVAPANGYLVFEDGPSSEIRLQWATYYDAADQAGQSRLWGGIHIWPDDHAGRLAGAEIGKAALDEAGAYFEGAAR